MSRKDRAPVAALGKRGVVTKVVLPLIETTLYLLYNTPKLPTGSASNRIKLSPVQLTLSTLRTN
jgi:hypothetical protein